MGTVIRSKISKKGKYYIPENRYLELKYFCRQYYDYKSTAKYLEEVLIPAKSGDATGIKSSDTSDITAKLATKLFIVNGKIDIIEKACLEADYDLREYILESVTKGTPFSVLEAKGIPCSKNTFYDRYRKFFWLLDRYR